jgi:hypothetical protein
MCHGGNSKIRKCRDLLMPSLSRSKGTPNLPTINERVSINNYVGDQLLQMCWMLVRVRDTIRKNMQ